MTDLRASLDTRMNARLLRQLLLREDINFLVTNRIPRLAVTRLFGRLSRVRSRWFTRASIAVWRLFTDLDLSDAKTTEFASVHACFTRELKPGARPFDARPDIVPSPCDAIVGACGFIDGHTLLQAKGMPYSVDELCASEEPARWMSGGVYATLRLTSAMYHRFHSPLDARLTLAHWIDGDAWNVNPPALARVDRLFCRNERAVLRLDPHDGGAPLVLVPVAAILVASLRLSCLPGQPALREARPSRLALNVPLVRGQELGWFEHGSTIIVLAPAGHRLAPGVAAGSRIRVGEALLARPDALGDRARS